MYSYICYKLDIVLRGLMLYIKLLMFSNRIYIESFGTHLLPAINSHFVF